MGRGVAVGMVLRSLFNYRCCGVDIIFATAPPGSRAEVSKAAPRNSRAPLLPRGPVAYLGGGGSKVAVNEQGDRAPRGFSLREKKSKESSQNIFFYFLKGATIYTTSSSSQGRVTAETSRCNIKLSRRFAL